MPKPVQGISKSQKRKIRRKNLTSGSGNFQTGSANFQTGNRNVQTGWNNSHETALIPTMHPGPAFGPTNVPNFAVFENLVTDRLPHTQFDQRGSYTKLPRQS